jgi:hypothetical protein
VGIAKSCLRIWRAAAGFARFFYTPKNAASNGQPVGNPAKIVKVIGNTTGGRPPIAHFTNRDESLNNRL